MGLRDFFNRFGKGKKEKEYNELVWKLQYDPEQKKQDHALELLLKEIDKLKNEKSKLKKKKAFKLIDAIIEVLGHSNSEMNAAQVLQGIQNRNLKTKKLKISSVRATLYYLINQKKIQYGLQRGTFTACVDVEGKNSPWDPR